MNVSNPLDSQSNASPLVTLEAAQPYEDWCTTTTSTPPISSCSWRTIPTGKRLVIQEIDTYVSLSSGSNLNALYYINSGFAVHYLVPTLVTNSGYFVYQSHQETRIYAGPGSTPTCNVGFTGTTELVSCSLSGFLVDTQ